MIGLISCGNELSLHIQLYMYMSTNSITRRNYHVIYWCYYTFKYIYLTCNVISYHKCIYETVQFHITISQKPMGYFSTYCTKGNHAKKSQGATWQKLNMWSSPLEFLDIGCFCIYATPVTCSQKY